MVTARILDADYKTDPLTVRLFCVDEEGDAFVAYDRSFRPYFYVLPMEDTADAVAEKLDGFQVEDDDARVTDVERVERIDGRAERTALKVYAAIPPHVPAVKDAVRDWTPVEDVRSYDIPFYKRYLIDTGVAPTEPVRLQGTYEGELDGLPVLRLDAPPEPVDAALPPLDVLAFDLEVYEDEIIMASFYGDGYERVLTTYRDGYEQDYVEVVDDEAALIQRLLAIVDERDPDIVAGYNTDEFDFDVLRERSEHHGIDLTMGRTGRRMTFQRRGRFSGATLEGRIHLDLYAFVENVVGMGLQSETLSLDAVAEELLGENKDDVSWEEIKQWWEEKTHLDELAQYALRDAELAYALGESLIPQVLSLARLTGLPPFDVCRHTYGRLAESYMIRRANARDMLVPNRPTSKERSERYRQGAYAGGFVYTPEEGLHEDIALFDFRSLYPTIIVAHNISPDTLDVDGCSEEYTVDVEESGHTYLFCQDEPGFIPDILEDLVRERYDLKADLADAEEDSQAARDMDTRQQALKILSNAFYGYLGYSGARWYSKPCAEATTALGRQYIHETIETARAVGFEVVYGDTDSVFLQGEDVKARYPSFLERVNDDLPAFMELEFEGFYPRGLFTSTDEGEGAKKKYALLAEDDTIKITGFEQVRRDWSQIAKDTQEAVIDHVLHDDVDSAVDVVEETIERLRSGDVPIEQLKIYTQMKKKPENYESKAPHTEAAKKAIKRGTEINPGDTIAYVITRGGGTISDRAELVDYAESYDADYYVRKQVIPVTLRILKVFGYTEGQLLGEGKQSGLDRFT